AALAPHPPANRTPAVGMPHHQGCEGRIIGGCRPVHPGNRLEWIVVEAQHHFAREAGAQDTLVGGEECLANCMQPEIAPAALVRYGKAIAADANFASPDNGKANASRSNDDDSPVSRAMRADAGNRRVMGVNDRAEGMRA